MNDLLNLGNFCDSLRSIFAVVDAEMGAGGGGKEPHVHVLEKLRWTLTNSVMPLMLCLH